MRGRREDKDARWVDIHEGEYDEEQTEWVRQAAALPGWAGEMVRRRFRGRVEGQSRHGPCPTGDAMPGATERCRSVVTNAGHSDPGGSPAGTCTRAVDFTLVFLYSIESLIG